MDYYFGNQLRWAYGFDNPNKAATLIATILPLLWLLVGGCSSTRNPMVRRPGLPVTAILFLACWWLLFKTYSRGGMVAAAVGCLFAVATPLFHRHLIWDQRKKRQYLITMAAVSIVICALFVASQAAERSVGWVGQHEGSIENRLTIWKAGLRMVTENPLGVGAGKSGAVYMQWYEPLDLNAGYRTMVNSFLTFLAERGFPVFTVAMFIAGVLWSLASGNRPRMMPLRSGALRGSILAFAVAGFFSTTMESPWLWIVPGFSLSLLLFFRLRQVILLRRLPPRPRNDSPPRVGESGRMMSMPWWSRTLLANGTICLLLSAGIFVTGWILDRNQPFTVRVARHQDLEVSLTLRNNPAHRSLSVYPDVAVLGPAYGKLLRRLASEAGTNICLSSETLSPAPGTAVVLSGEAAAYVRVGKGTSLILLAPVTMEETQARTLLHDASKVVLLLPSFDEDGRVSFWQDIAASAAEPSLNQKTLTGVGTEVDWAWDEVVKECKSFTSAASHPADSMSSQKTFQHISSL